MLATCTLQHPHRGKHPLFFMPTVLVTLSEPRESRGSEPDRHTHMHAGQYTRTQTHTHACTQAHTHTRPHTRTRARPHTRTHAHTHACTPAHTPTHPDRQYVTCRLEWTAGQPLSACQQHKKKAHQAGAMPVRAEEHTSR